jgi:anti-sigma-K factor RskA
MMKPLSDEILVAYADDELPPAERAAVERRLAHDAEARDRLAAFTSTGQWLARAYDDTLREPVPEGLLAAIRDETGTASPTGSGTAKQRSLWRRLGAPDWRSAWPAMGGVGLGLATGIALMLVWPGAGPLSPDVALLVDQALETAAGGEPLQFELAGERLEITPIGTVRTAAGEVCREFTQVRSTAAPQPVVTHGLACRAADGPDALVWRTVARVELLPPTAETPGFGLASGAPQVLLDALVETLGEVEQLSPDAERQLLEAGWE